MKMKRKEKMVPSLAICMFLIVFQSELNLKMMRVNGGTVTFVSINSIALFMKE